MAGVSEVSERLQTGEHVMPIRSSTRTRHSVPTDAHSTSARRPGPGHIRRSGLVVACVLLICSTARGQQQAPNQPGTKWTDNQLRQSIELARVGKKLTPKVWPNQSRV